MKEKISDIQDVIARLRAICSTREICTSEARTKLAKEKISPEESDEIIAVLINDKYIDDRRYAGAFARDKARLSKWGPLKIRMGLRAKQISEEFITDALQELDKTEHKETLESIVKKKYSSLANDDNPASVYGKLMRFGLSRGFDYAEVSETVRKIMEFSI